MSTEQRVDAALLTMKAMLEDYCAKYGATDGSARFTAYAEQRWGAAGRHAVALLVSRMAQTQGVDALAVLAAV